MIDKLKLQASTRNRDWILMSNLDDIAKEQWKRELEKSIPSMKIRPRPIPFAFTKTVDEIKEKIDKKEVKNKEFMDCAEIIGGIEKLEKLSGLGQKLTDIIYEGRTPTSREKKLIKRIRLSAEKIKT
jgi:hypothetical protein